MSDRGIKFGRSIENGMARVTFPAFDGPTRSAGDLDSHLRHFPYPSSRDPPSRTIVNQDRGNRAFSKCEHLASLTVLVIVRVGAFRSKHSSKRVGRYAKAGVRCVHPYYSVN